MDKRAQENIVRATLSASSTGMAWRLAEDAAWAAALRSGGEVVPLEEIEDEELFAWAMGYWSVLCQAAAAYERGTWIIPDEPAEAEETARPDSDPGGGSHS